MTFTDWINRRPEKVGDRMRTTGLDNSRRIRRKGTDFFRKEYLKPIWYKEMRRLHRILIEGGRLPKDLRDVTRSQLLHITNAGRKVMQDNLIPVKAIETANEEERGILRVGHLNQVVYYNGYTPLSDREQVDITPYTRNKNPIESKRIRKTIRIDRSVTPYATMLGDILWQMDYQDVEATFGERDYEGTKIERRDEPFWVRAMLERTSPFLEQTYGRPERMAFTEQP